MVLEWRTGGRLWSANIRNLFRQTRNTLFSLVCDYSQAKVVIVFVSTDWVPKVARLNLRCVIREEGRGRGKQGKQPLEGAIVDRRP